MWVKVKNLRPSSILPKRWHDPKISDSVKRCGVQQPIIVRPRPASKFEFEIIDGHGRVESLDGNTKVLVEVKYDLKDVDVFRLSETTFQRNDRTTYETALFYKSWMKAMIKDTGKERGSQKRIAEEANLSEAQVSQYLSISKLFDRLKLQNIPERNFDALKNQGINKLYELAKVEDESVIMEIAQEMATNPNMPLDDLKDLIETRTEDRQLQPLLEEDEEEEETNTTTQLTNAAQELKLALDETTKTLTHLTSRIAGNTDRFLPLDAPKRLLRMLNALRRVEKEANKLIREIKKDTRSAVRSVPTTGERE